MFAQQRQAGSQQQVAIITDHSAGLPRDIAEHVSIDVVPLRINFGDRDYLDKVSLQPCDFDRMVRQDEALPRTSQPPIGDSRRQFESRLAHHPELTYVGLSRAGSGTLQAAVSAADRLGREHVHGFDTASASDGQALLTLAAAGETSGRILSELQRLRLLTLTWAAARDIRHAVRGGRVPRWAGTLASGLGLTPARARWWFRCSRYSRRHRPDRTMIRSLERVLRFAG